MTPACPCPVPGEASSIACGFVNGDVPTGCQCACHWSRPADSRIVKKGTRRQSTSKRGGCH